MFFSKILESQPVDVPHYPGLPCSSAAQTT